MPSLTATQSAQACANRGSPKRRSESPGTSSHSDAATRPSQAGGFGLLLLLLAALPYEYQSGQNNGVPTLEGGCEFQARGLASTANLRFCASLDDVMRAGRRALEFDFEDEDTEDDVNPNETEEERRRRRKRKQMLKKKQQGGKSTGSATVTPLHADSTSLSGMSYTTSSEDDVSSSQGNTEELVNSFSSVPTTTTTTQTTTVHQYHDEEEVSFTTLTDLGEDILSYAMSFLPLKDLNKCRGLSQAFHAAAACDVPTPFPGSVFMRFTETHRGTAFATPPNRNLLKWTCGYCSTQNNLSFQVCRQCQGGNGDCQGVRKVFLGQLRKERTTELADWMLSRIFPEMQPLHIENHTGKDNRGKGCAWIYVTSAADEAKVLSLNKRMFVDVDDDGQEGVWLCDKSHCEELNNMATSRAYKAKRPQVLPRQPLTAEKPGTRSPPISRGSAPKNGPRVNSIPQQHWQTQETQHQQQMMDTQSTAQELWEQHSGVPTPAVAAATAQKLSGRGFPTHTSTASTRALHHTAVPRSRQPQQSAFQYKPNSISVYDYSQVDGTPSAATAAHSKTPSSSGSSSGGASWTHNPYGASVLADSYLTIPAISQNLNNQYYAPAFSPQYYAQYQNEDYSAAGNNAYYGSGME